MPKLYLAMARGQYDAVAPPVLRMRHYYTTAVTMTTDCATGFSNTRLRGAERKYTCNDGADRGGRAEFRGTCG